MRRGPVGPAESAAEATKGLIERRQYSRNVNYKAIDSLFESIPDDEDSRAGTPLHGVDEKTDEKGEDDDEHGESSGVAWVRSDRELIALSLQVTRREKIMVTTRQMITTKRKKNLLTANDRTSIMSSGTEWGSGSDPETVAELVTVFS